MSLVRCQRGAVRAGVLLALDFARLASALALVAACHHHGPPSAPPLQVAAPPAGSSIRVRIPADGVCLPSPTPGMMITAQGAVAPEEAAAECHAVRGDTAPAGEWRFVIRSAAAGHTLTCQVGACSSPPVTVVVGGMTSRGIVVSNAP